MAERFKFIAMNAPRDCEVSMEFNFHHSYPITEFFEKINIAHLFHNVAYWQGAQFTFYVHGVDANHNFVNEKL